MAGVSCQHTHPDAPLPPQWEECMYINNGVAYANCRWFGTSSPVWNDLLTEEDNKEWVMTKSKRYAEAVAYQRKIDEYITFLKNRIKRCEAKK